MSIEEIKKVLEMCTRPLDFFGDVSLDEISKKYKKYARHCHPDIAPPDKKELAEETIKMLNEIYDRAEKEYEKGIYNITDPKELYKHTPPIIEFKLKNKTYKFYKDLGYGDVCNTYEGLCDNELVFLRIVLDENDNDLLKEEYKMLRELEHLSLPKVISYLSLNGRSAIIYKKMPGLTTEEIIKTYGRIPGEHVAWMIERMLSLIGYLHENKIIHGNIKPSNVIIDTDMHNVYLDDYSLSVKDANEDNKKYQIINENFTPSYVNSNALITPNVDIYGVGKIAILLLGGDIKSNGMPVDCDLRLRTFIRKLVDENQRQCDAWALWDELIALRNEVYGTARFKKLERKL